MYHTKLLQRIGECSHFVHNIFLEGILLAGKFPTECKNVVGNSASYIIILDRAGNFPTNFP